MVRVEAAGDGARERVLGHVTRGASNCHQYLWIEAVIVTRGRGRAGVMPRMGVSRDLLIISG